MSRGFPRTLLGLEPRAVEAELAAERLSHRSMLEQGERLLAALVAEERSLTERTARLRARQAHLEEAITTLAPTLERDQRIAARAEERLQNELVLLEGAHRRQLSELRREEAGLRSLLHRDEERFRSLVTRLRATLAASSPAVEATPPPILQAAIAQEPAEAE